METQKDSLGHSQVIKAALHCTVGQITEDVEKEFGLKFSKPVIATIAEFINRQIETYALDLEAFAKHARRSTVTFEDVKLLLRRNPQLQEKIKDIYDTVQASSSTGGPTKAKKKSVAGAPTPADETAPPDKCVEIVDSD